MGCLLVKLGLFIVILGGWLSSCATVLVMKNNLSQKLWCDEPQVPVRSVVVMLHGLNLKPKKMDDWSKLLTDHGALVVRASLYGHQGSYEEMRDVTADIWRKQFQEAMAEAKMLADKHGVPLSFIGFSLGALVALEGIKDWPISKMVLIAPALSTPWYSETAIKMLSIFGRGFMLPSRSPKNYRANRGTSIAAYQALFELKDSLEKNDYQNANKDTLVLIDRADELVSFADIRKAIEKHHLSRWDLQIISNQFAYKNYGFRHLMVDQEAMGKELWSQVSSMVLKHVFGEGEV